MHRMRKDLLRARRGSPILGGVFCRGQAMQDSRTRHWFGASPLAIALAAAVVGGLVALVQTTRMTPETGLPRAAPTALGLPTGSSPVEGIAIDSPPPPEARSNP